jgi:hypothetical protein
MNHHKNTVRYKQGVFFSCVGAVVNYHAFVFPVNHETYYVLTYLRNDKMVTYAGKIDSEMIEDDNERYDMTHAFFAGGIFLDNEHALSGME